MSQLTIYMYTKYAMTTTAHGVFGNVRMTDDSVTVCSCNPSSFNNTSSPARIIYTILTRIMLETQCLNKRPDFAKSCEYHILTF